LRVNRTRPKALVHEEDEELLPETVAFFPFESRGQIDSEALLFGQEQEVGIT
jgi:hypothetical protein